MDYRGLILPDAPQYERRASGFILMDDGNGPVETAATLRCVHCGSHFISIKGSGRKRGFCTRCMGVTCGIRKCDECYAWQKKIDDYEKGKLVTLS